MNSKTRLAPKMSNITQKWVDLLMPISEAYSDKMTASELARKSGIPQQTASRLLNELARTNLISYSKEGKNKLFYLDTRRQTAKTILNLIENQKALRFQLEQKEIAVIIEEMLKYCESLIVFGSYASGEFTAESDLDIVILEKYKKEAIKKIKQKQTREINEHYASYSKFAEQLKSRNPLAIEIMKKHILFGDAPKIINIFLENKP